MDLVTAVAGDAEITDTTEDTAELEVCMQDLGEALAKKDWAGAAAAFKASKTVCDSYEE